MTQLAEKQHLHLSVRDRDIFIQVLLHPPKPSDNVLKSIQMYKRDIISIDHVSTDNLFSKYL